MTTAATQYPLVGSQPVGNFFQMDNTQRHVLGSLITFNDPFWGGGEAIYLQMPVSTVLQVGTALAWDTATSFVATPIANTANLGKGVAFLMNALASSTTTQFGWAYVSGQAPVYSNASVAADSPIGIAAAGQLGANTAGKEILNARVTKPATTTIVKANGTATGGSNLLRVQNTDGLFVGVFLSGTGIAAGTTVTIIDPDNRTLTLSAATTAAVNSAVTATYNNGTVFYNVLTFDRPFAEGAIT